MNATSSPCLAAAPSSLPKEHRAAGAAGSRAVAATPPQDTAEQAGWPDSLLDHWFEAWAQRAEARWARELSPLPLRYY